MNHISSSLTRASGLVAAVGAVLVAVALAPGLDASSVESALELIGPANPIWEDKENQLSIPFIFVEIDRPLTFTWAANLVLAVLTVPVAVASSPHPDASWKSKGAEELGPAVVGIVD